MFNSCSANCEATGCCSACGSRNGECFCCGTTRNSIPMNYANGEIHRTVSSVQSNCVDEKPDRSRITEISTKTDRQWVAVTAYQPIDTVVKTVEVPVIKTIETYVPKHIVETKVVEVPKYIDEFVDKIVEVEEVVYKDREVEESDIQYNFQYVPKTEIKENIIRKPVIETKYTEKIEYVPEFREVVREEPYEVVENIIRYVPKGEDYAAAKEAMEKKQERVFSDTATQIENKIQYQNYGEPQNNFSAYTPRTKFGQYIQESNQPKVSQVYKPKIVQTVEIQKQVPVSVDVPVPYMVPKPIIVPCQVPVLKFRDHFVPIPVRRRVVPRIRWTNEVYEVECIKEKPFLQIQDIIKPVPCDVEIKVHEFVEKAQPINPAELSQADIHAMWMRVNADLADEKKEQYGDKYPYVQYPQGTVFGEPGCDEDTANTKDLEAKFEDPNQEEQLDVFSLHPGHPLAMSYLQNQWLKKDTTSTHQMYTPEWFEAHQKAMHGIQMQHPTQVQLTAEQAASLHAGRPPFEEPMWMETDENGHPKMKFNNEVYKQQSGGNCFTSECISGTTRDPNPNSACCSAL